MVSKKKIKLDRRKIALCMIGSSIMAFGLYNVHSLSGVTEGGILGMTLLLNYWLDLSPAITGFIMNAACYLVGWKLLGWSFILYSTIAGFTFSASYAVFEQFPRLWPGISGYAADGSHRGSAVHRYRRGTLREGRAEPPAATTPWP